MTELIPLDIDISTHEVSIHDFFVENTSFVFNSRNEYEILRVYFILQITKG